MGSVAPQRPQTRSDAPGTHLRAWVSALGACLKGRHAPPSAWRPPIPWWGWTLLVVGTIAIYYNSLPNAFHNDDDWLILENPSVHPSASLFDHFRSATAGAAHLPTRGYRPLVMVTYSLNYAWGGSDVTGYHVVNIGLHAVSAVLVVLLLWHLSASPMAAILGGVLFAVHPIHTEAVNYITARSSVLYTLWSLLTVIFFIRFRQTGRVSALAGALVSFAAALLAKEAAIVVPVLLVAYDVYVRGVGVKGLRRWIAPHLALLSVSVAFLLVRWMVIGAFGPKALPNDIGTVFLTFAMVFKKTLQGQLVPVQLSAFHPKDYAATVADPAVITGCAMLVAMVALSVALYRRVPLLSFGLTWFPVGLLPIAVLAMFTEMDLYQENRGYFSSVGLIVIAAPLLAAGWGEGLARNRIAARLLIAGLILAMGISVVQRNPAWKDPVTLWTDVANKYPDDPSSHMILARAHRLTGDPASAINVLERATARLPPNAILYNDLCALYVQESAFDRASRACLAAIQRGPKLPNPYFSLGTIYWKTGRPDLAIEAYEAFLKLAGDQPKFSVLVQEAQSRLSALRPNPAGR
ncbi:MAG: tetratricopeptide repeat protein [Nitrospirota bacterium]